MKYKFRFTKKAAKEYDKLEKIIRERTAVLIDKLETADNPKRLGRKIVGSDNLYRYKIGVYRLIVEIKDNELLLTGITVGHRKAIYRDY